MPLPDILIHIVALLGAILISYGVFLEAEKRQDAVFMIGGLALLVYALSLANPIFIITTGLFTACATFEFVQIVLGHHPHPTSSFPKKEE